jgi:ABC-type phosphate/phosphonate transport system substrate-binding protein
VVSIARFGGLLAFATLTLGTIEKSSAQAPAPAKPRDSVVIGIPESLFQGVPEVLRKFGAAPFLKLMKDNTGINGTLEYFPDAMALAKQIDAGKVQLGVFQGHEFAWAKAKYGKLTPIVVADPLDPVQAICLVRWDCKANNIGELKAQKISLPPVHRDYCQLFLAKQKLEHMKGQKFSGQLDAAQATDAIFDVIEKKAGCTVVDCMTLNFFKSVYPGQYQNLKVLCQSEVFPNACICFKEGDLNPQTVGKFRDALLKAAELPGGRNLLLSWKLKGFVKVPDDYDALLKKVQKGYEMPPVAVTIDK